MIRKITLNASYNDIVQYINEGKAVYAKIPYEYTDDYGSTSGCRILLCVEYDTIQEFYEDSDTIVTYQIIFIGDATSFYFTANSPDENLSYEEDMQPAG